MKELTLKELSELTNISTGTIRSWTLKPIQGQPYNSKNINYDALRSQLTKYFESKEQFKKRFGFSIDQIKIIKGERATKEYVQFNELEIGDMIIMHNYALQTEMTLVSKHFVKVDQESGDGIELWTFELADKPNNFKCYTEVQLTSANIKLERKVK